MVTALLVAGCGAQGGTLDPTAPPPALPTQPGSPTASPLPPRPVDHPTLWLCRPGLADNPCEGGLDATVIDADGTRTRERFEPAEDPPVDCFYVYPTVSEGTSDNAPMEVTDAEVRTVRAQAARFAASCRLFAPIYRQITRRGLVSGALSRPAARERAYVDVLSAFNDYLNTENGGRPFVLIGHSQGATVLTALIQRQIDGNPRLRSQLLSALLLGGPVTVAPGSGAGGSFVNVPACRSSQETGCVVAYATYAGTPPTNGLFGRSTADRQALCVSPAALLGRGEQLEPYFPTPDLVDESGAAGDGPEPGFTARPEAVTATCRTTDDFSWLDVDIGLSPNEYRTAVPESMQRSPAWGLHIADVNLTLGDLVGLVAAQGRAYGR
jgi:pimeloyl-ACP methyl ester carboxylesterase